MSEKLANLKFSIHHRFSEFWANLKSEPLRKDNLIIHLLGWFITFLLIFVYLRPQPSGIYHLLAILHVYFWFKLIGIFYRQIPLPVELLLLVFILVHQINLLLFSSVGEITSNASASALIEILQVILLAFQVLLFSIILVQNNNGKRGILLGFAILGAIVFYFLHRDAVITSFFLQLILLLLLLSKTRWLAELTQIECWVYWLITLVLFIWWWDKGMLPAELPGDLRAAIIWHKIPYYLFLLFKMYLLALLIKIPAVLIYHHARLSRKLWIASLFQSTFPQFIQFFMMIAIFYFFISSWQAENLRTSIFERLETIEENADERGLTHYRVDLSVQDTVLSINSYQPFQIDKGLQGFVLVEAVPVAQPSKQSEFDYLLMYPGVDTLKNEIHLVKIDSFSLGWISEDLPLLLGSQILAYPFKTANRIESLLYQATSTARLGPMVKIFPFMLLPRSEKSMQIFPFALMPHRAQMMVSYNLQSGDEMPNPIQLEIMNRDIGKGKITVGRVFIPILNANAGEEYFAFDILVIPSFAFLSSPILRLLAFLSIFYMLINFLVTRRMIKFGEKINDLVVHKFEQLMKGIREISTGNLDYKVKMEGEDEFVELAERFNRMGDRLQQTIAESIEKERLEHELNVARGVQLSLLPPELPEVPGYEVAATLKTATEVGGDFYDVLPLGKNKFLFAVGDVSGKGSSAALYMAQCISLLRFAQQFTVDPAEIVRRLNSYFSDPTVDRQIFVTAIMGVLDVKRNRFKFVRAGHPHPFLISKKGKEKPGEVMSTGLGIGMTKEGTIFEKKLKVVEVKFSPGDTLIFYSDGLVEAARSVSEEKELEYYGMERLSKLLDSLQGKTAAEVLAELEADVQSFYRGQPMVDDYTVMVVRRGGWIKPLN